MRKELVRRESAPTTRHRGALDFDYGSVSSLEANFLRGQAERIRRHCVTATIQIGKALIESKRHLGHGEFTLWVEAEVGIPIRTAQVYMRVAAWAADKCATVARLSPTSLYLLSASSTPSSFVGSVIKRVESGETISTSILREELHGLRWSNEPPRSTARDLKKDKAEELTEVISILVERLSQTEFARVQCIMTSDTVVGDPNFPQMLAMAFRHVPRTVCSNIKPSRPMA